MKLKYNIIENLKVKAATEQTNFVIKDNRELLAVTISATLEAVKRYPANQVLLFDLLALDSTSSYQESWIESHKTQLTQLTQYIQSEMAEKIVNKAIERTFQSDTIDLT